MRRQWDAARLNNNEIHLVVVDSGGRLDHYKRAASNPYAWSTVQSNITGLTSHTRVSLSTDGTNLWAIYDKNDNKIYYRKWDGSSWGSERILKDTTTALQGAIDSSEKMVNNRIGVVWVEGSGSPYNVQFSLIDENFLYRKAITIDDTKVSPCSSNITDFPVLISITGDANLKTVANGGHVANSNGYDIVFRASNGLTALDHEVESYDGTAGTLVAWVKVPTLSYTADTTIYIYYGNSGISSDQSNPTGVWDANFKGVWHLKENPAGTAPQMKNSKTNANHGTHQ